MMIILNLLSSCIDTQIHSWLGDWQRLLKKGKYVSISGFTNKISKPILVPVVDAEVSYICNKSGKIMIMIIRNALHVPEMNACLLYSIMMCLVNIQVDECPKFLSDRPTERNYSIYFSDLNLRIPLDLCGIISFIPCKTATEHEMINNDGVLELTPNIDDWNPHDSKFQDQENDMMEFSGNDKSTRPRNFIMSAVSHQTMHSNLFCNDVLDNYEVGGVKFIDQESSMNTKELARMWNISVDLARKTIAVTSRKCRRNTKDITLSQGYPYNNRMIH